MDSAEVATPTKPKRIRKPLTPEQKAHRKQMAPVYHLRYKPKMAARRLLEKQLGIFAENCRLFKESQRVKKAGRPIPDVCEACHLPEVALSTHGNVKALAFDHCHETGKFRGWVCMRCNLIMGKAKDSVDTLNKIITYLERDQ